MTTRNNRYGAEGLAHPEGIVAQLQRVLGPLARWQAAYLHQMVLLLPDHAASFKSARPAARPSELIRALERTYKNPGPMTEGLVGADVTRDEAWHVVDTDATAVILLYHYARMIWGDQAERHLGKEGDALDHLRACPDPANAMKASATRALKVLEPKRLRGRGGHRNTRDTALKLANEHILDVYVTITRQLPSLSVLSKSKNPAVQIKGAAVDFLEICLEIMGLRTSRPTLRRCIEDYRRRMQPPSDQRRRILPLPIQ